MFAHLNKASILSENFQSKPLPGIVNRFSECFFYEGSRPTPHVVIGHCHWTLHVANQYDSNSSSRTGTARAFLLENFQHRNHFQAFAIPDQPRLFLSRCIEANKCVDCSSFVIEYCREQTDSCSRTGMELLLCWTRRAFDWNRLEGFMIANNRRHLVACHRWHRRAFRSVGFARRCRTVLLESIRKPKEHKQCPTFFFRSGNGCTRTAAVSFYTFSSTWPPWTRQRRGENKVLNWALFARKGKLSFSVKWTSSPSVKANRPFLQKQTGYAMTKN